MHRFIPTTVFLFFLILGTAAADDEPAPRKQQTPAQAAAAAVLKTYDARDEPAIRALAARDLPDPWLVADELCYQGNHDAAAAFARASLSIDFEKLPAYIAALRQKKPDTAERKLLATLNAALQARSAEEVVAGTASLGDGIAGVLAIRLAYGRGLALRMLGRLKESAEVLGQAAGAAESLGWIRQAGLLYAKAGLSAEAASEWQAALNHWGTSLQIFRHRGDKLNAARLLSNLGSVHSRRGEYARDLGFQQEAMKVMTALGDKRGAARTLSIIGAIHSDLGEYAKALSVQERALAQATSLGDTYEASIILNRIATVYSHIGEHRKALALLETQLKENTALGNRSAMAAAMLNMSIVYNHLGEHKEALALQERALTLVRTLGNAARIARYQVNLSSTYNLVGDFTKALAVLNEALVGLKAVGDQAGLAGALVNIGEAHRALGNLKKARAALKQGERVARSIRSVPVQVLALEALAGLYLDSGESALALATALRAVRTMEGMLAGYGLEQGASARGEQAKLLGIGALAAVGEEDAPELLSFLESGRAGALLAALGKREELRWRAEALPVDLKRKDEEATAGLAVARREFDESIRRGNRKLSRARRAALDRATELVRDIANRIERELKHQAKPDFPLAETIENIQSVLVPGQALVLYGLCRGEVVALTLLQDAERIVKLGDLGALRDACAALDLSSLDHDPVKATAALRALLVEPLHLAEDIKHVLIAPEGVLCYVPFSVLFDQTVCMTPSGTTHLRLMKDLRRTGKGILALGNPDYSGVSEGAKAAYYRGRALAPLPATGPEAEAVGSTVLVGAEASEAGLRSALPKATRWRAVHFACHGLIDLERPMFSALALSRADEDDGFLTALEVWRMGIPTDLAVLSACETGKGRIVKGEGIVGLSSAFIFAGSPRVLCSLWKVDDEATKALMVEFYRLWNPKDGSKGVGPAAALKTAQAFVRDHVDDKGKRHWEHPRYWAAWVLWGLPD